MENLANPVTLGSKLFSKFYKSRNKIYFGTHSFPKLFSVADLEIVHFAKNHKKSQKS
jgi:hypothetical protein